MSATLLLASCARQVADVSTPVTTRDTHAAYAATAGSESAACADMGPFSCNLAPSSSEDLCDQLAKCLATRDSSKANIRVSGCGELSTFEEAPLESGVKRVAVVNVDGDVNGESGQGSYLVAERDGGFCLIDQAVSWASTSGGYLDTDSRLEWHSDGGKTLLSVRTQALRFDEEEDDDEGANVRAALCRDAEYALAGGRFVTVRELAVNEPCSDEDE